MLKFIMAIIILVLAVWAGLYLTQDPGYAVFGYHDWSVAMPLWVALIIVVTAIYLLYFVLSCLRGFKVGKLRWRHRKDVNNMSKSENKLELMQSLYDAQNNENANWSKVIELLRPIKKYKLLDKDEIVGLEKKSHLKQLKNLADKASGEALDGVEKFWSNLPKHLKSDVDMINVYVGALIFYKQDSQAESLLKTVLNKHWDSRLARHYGMVHGAKPKAQLKLAMGWLKKHSDDAMLLLTLGRLSQRLQIWGQAREYFEQSLAVEKHPETYYELGILLEREGGSLSALKHYRDGLMANI